MALGPNFAYDKDAFIYLFIYLFIIVPIFIFLGTFPCFTSFQ